MVDPKVQKEEEKQPFVEIRLSNTIYKCELEEKFYNAKDSQPYAVTLITGVAPSAKGGFSMSFASLIMCEKCWKENQNKEGLGLTEPSGLILPN